MKSWKTTLCGVLAIVGAGMTQFFHDTPMLFKIGGFLATVAPACGLLFARDNNVTSEQAGATAPRSGAGTPFLALAAALGLSALMVGCAGLNRSIITVTDVVDSAMTEYADAQVRGLTTPALDAKVKAAHAEYQKAAGLALVAYQTATANGDKPAALATLKTLREAVDPLFDLITPKLAADRAVTLSQQLNQAAAP